MRHHIVELDHLMCGVDSPQAAGETFERLGFRVTPLSVIEPMGLGNRCVLFEQATPGAANYLELMGIVDAAKVPDGMRRTLAGGEGIKSLVLSTDDSAACHRALADGGYAPPGPPIHLSRQWALGPADVVEPAFAVLLPMPAPLGFNVCEHKTLPLYLRPDWTRHPNGARGFASAIAVADDPPAVAAFYERLFARGARVDGDGLVAVSPARVALRIGTPAAIAAAFGVAVPAAPTPRLLGIGIRVSDLEALGARLVGAQVPHHRAARDALVVPARHACGNLLVFTADPE